MSKQTQTWLLTAILAFSLTSPALAGSKVDWDKKLAKPRLLITTNNIEEALKILKEYERKYPASGALRTEIGRAYKARGKMSMAKSEFKRSTEVEPEYAEAWYELGAMEESDKEYQLAANDYEKYLQLAPDSDKKATVMDRITYCKNRIE